MAYKKGYGKMKSQGDLGGAPEQGSLGGNPRSMKSYSGKSKGGTKRAQGKGIQGGMMGQSAGEAQPRSGGRKRSHRMKY